MYFGHILNGIRLNTFQCPLTHLGQILFAIGCGLLTVFIRYFGSYPEGVSFAILVMNTCVVLLDKVGIPKRFGVAGKGGAAK